MPHWLISAAFFAQENAKPQNGDAGTLPPWLPLLAIGILFYFLMIRPQSREKAKRQELLNALKKNDKIVTIGGILGTIRPRRCDVGHGKSHSGRRGPHPAGKGWLA